MDVWLLQDDRGKRLMAASEARSLGYGGISKVKRAYGLSRKAIAKGIEEIADGNTMRGRICRRGAGRRKITVRDTKLMSLLESMIEPETRGHPESPLRWICKSTRTLAAQLTTKRHPISHEKVAQILREQNYSLQCNRKTEEGADHPDRDAQFRHINIQAKRALKAGIPVISVDAKKKELLGNYKNSGRQWLPVKKPVRINGYDFPSLDIPRAYPYGIYDIARNRGFVNIGTDMIRGRLRSHQYGGGGAAKAEGRLLYSGARVLLITADGGGSNGSRLRLWKLELQTFADETGISVSVCHFPPGTSKWNKVEHRLFSFISSNWRGEPLRDHETIVNLIARTTTAKGLQVICRLDRRKYPIGRKVTDEEFKRINLKQNTFQGDWNYIISPSAHEPS